MTPSPRAVALDGAIALGLAVALSVVFAADRSTPRTEVVADQPVVVTPPPPPPEEVPSKPLRLAVTPGQFDDMGKLLHELGSGYNYTDIRLEDLEDGTKLANYDVVFFTCGFDPDSWHTGESVGPLRRGFQARGDDPNAMERIRTALRGFVGKGGTLYASDWRLGNILPCFRELADGENIVAGAGQTLTANVVDPGLNARIGSTVELTFDLDGWWPARLTAQGGTVYLRGRYRAQADGATIEAPLLVRVPFEHGSIVFTSFHNEKVNSELETKLLQFLVFTAVTAKETQKSRATMVTGGFVPRSESLLDASAGSPSATQTYEHPRRGKLRFALSFNNQGAKLKLSVRGPDGSTKETEGTSTFSIDINDAAQGRWSYTITALKLPHEHFPFSLTIGGD